MKKNDIYLDYNTESTNSNHMPESIELKDKAYKKKKLAVSMTPAPNISEKRRNFFT